MVISHREAALTSLKREAVACSDFASLPGDRLWWWQRRAPAHGSHGLLLRPPPGLLARDWLAARIRKNSLAFRSAWLDHLHADPAKVETKRSSGETMNSVHLTRVHICHNDPLIAAGVGAALRNLSDIEVVGTHDSTATTFSHHSTVHVVVADYQTALELVAGVLRPMGHRDVEKARVLVITRCDTGWHIRHALESGVRGYLLQGCTQEEVADAVRALRHVGRYLGSAVAQPLADSIAFEMLTDREMDVLRLLTDGRGNKAIAYELNIALGTVKSHVRSILQKVNASTRTEAAAIADRRGLLSSLHTGKRELLSVEPETMVVTRPFRNGRSQIESSASKHYAG